MSWYYSENNERRGPVDEAAFATLVGNGTVKPDTLVWREGQGNWLPYAQVMPGSVAQTSAGLPAVSVACAECGKTFSTDEMISYEGRYICATCKPIFFQKLKEGASLPGQRRFAGFWIRFAAAFIDGIINQILGLIVGLVVGIAIQGEAAALVAGLLGFLMGVAYHIYFVGTYGATPGKMALKLKIIRADGSPVGFGLATGRFFAQFVSAFIIGIGYIMAAFDDEKRSLHDRICDTRVVHE